MPWTLDPPTYNSRYGYSDGAQEDIFIAAPAEPSSSGTNTPSGTASTRPNMGLPTTSTPSSSALGRGVGYRIPRMSPTLQ